MKPVLFAIWALLVAVHAAAAAPMDDADTFFETSIRPVLAGQCFKCHGGEKASSGLRVDSREALLKGGESGPVIVPGDAERSLILQAIRRGGDLKMPPDAPLAAESVAALARWINDGAKWPERAAEQAFAGGRHWAFQPVAEAPIPADNKGWATTPIDRFIAARHVEKNVKPHPPADRATLLRRVTFDLTGLPPTPAELDAFLSDNSPDAYDRLIERLLASPHYGQRWGRHWLDVVRYADTAGDNADYPVPEARHYRDFVIAAFNTDKPFDEFVREQLAGDILAAAASNGAALNTAALNAGQPQARARYAERVAATGFLALSRRYATAPYELWHLTLEDTIDTTGRAFLGLSLRCARCHDHKFDPVTAQDYYALYGIFASTQYAWAGGEEFQSKKLPREHFSPLIPPAEAAERLAAQRDQIARLEVEIKHVQSSDADAKRISEIDGRLKVLADAQSAKSQPAGTTSASEAAVAPDVDREALQKERAEAQRRLNGKLDPIKARVWQLRKMGLPDDLPGAYAVHDSKPIDAAVQRRGEPANPGEVVPRGAPKFLSGDQPLQIPAGASGRLQLAEWLTRPEHPLTARVIVNRVWQHHFGKGLVATPSNFGLRGEAPTHPELLDWLAGEFVRDGWSIKNLHRLILRSKTYQLASGAAEGDANTPSNLAIDPSNRWYWRFDRRRLEAEAIRDAMLAAAGNLDVSMPSAHPFPPFKDWNWTQHTPFKAVYPSNHRSVYLMTQRLVRHPYLALFDGPDPNTSTDVRTQATVPLQALYLMNNPFVTEQAAAFAASLLAVESDPMARIRQAYRVAYGREPRESERQRGLQYIDAYTAASDIRAAWSSYARVLLTANEFVFID